MIIIASQEYLSSANDFINNKNKILLRVLIKTET